MIVSELVNDIILSAILYAKQSTNEFVTPEHLLKASLGFDDVKNLFIKVNGDIETLNSDLDSYISLLDTGYEEPDESESFKTVLINSSTTALASESEVVDLSHILNSIFSLEESYAVYFLNKNNFFKEEILFELVHNELTLINDPDTKKSSKSNSFLSKYTDVLTEKISFNKLIGRASEINRTIQLLLRKEKNNPIFVGDPGVGKTSLVYGLVDLIKSNEVPEKLQNSTVFNLDISRMLAGTKYRGDFEERLKGTLDELNTIDKPIVYIDEIHTLVGAGSLGNGSLDASNILKPYLIDSKIRFIGSTTFDEYKKHLENDKGLVRRFAVVEVKEPSIDESIEILMGIKESYELYHNVSYTKDSIKAAVKLSAKYINNKYLPDKAIDLLDEAGSHKNMTNGIDGSNKIDKDDIEEILYKTYKIPKSNIEKEEKDILFELENNLKKKIFGQDKAILETVSAIKTSRAGLNDDDKPIASFLFVGPTGVGKTELSKSIANEFDMDLIRFDMSEYSEKHSASKLIGTPPGYVGYEEGGLLADSVRKSPNCILLLDEIEKAHEDVLNVLLQVMDYATLTDNKGRKVSFKNSIIIMTSNAGAREVGKSLVGFGDRKNSDNAIDVSVKKTFSPEFRNRLSSIIKFNPLKIEQLKEITLRQIELLKSKIAKKDVELVFENTVIDFISKKGFGYEYGGREILRIIDKDVKPLLVDIVLFGKSDSKTLVLTVIEDKICIK